MLTQHFHTSNSTHFIYDSLNRVSIFHGSNFVQKSFPWYPESLLHDSHIQDLKKAGFNAVRLGLFWTGAEPVEGQYNQTYYDIMGGIVDNLAANGIYTFIDVHQDVLSTKFCLYDAFPLWAIDKAAPSKDFPWPLQWDGVNPCPATRGWGANYFADSTGKAFDGLYHNYNGLTDSFSAFWKHTAAFFKDRPIIGFEIINEPWAGDIYTQPDLLLPGHAGAKNLQPFYDTVAEAIRSVDSKHIIMYEPVTWGMIFNGDLLGSGLTAVPGGASFADQSILSYHYYCWWLDTNSDLTKQTCDRGFGPKVMEQVLRDVRRTGGAAMLTEWGQGCADQLDRIDVNNASSFSECTAVMDLADDHFMSWTDWYFGERLNGNWFDFSDSSSSSATTSATWPLFSRPFARYIAGTPLSMKFDISTKTFDFCFIPGVGSEKVATELFVNFDVFYPLGYDITVSSDALVSQVDAANNLVVLKSSRAVSSDSHKQLKACVSIASKA